MEKGKEYVEPDVTKAPERWISEETEREKFKREVKSEYLENMDKHFEDIKGQKAGRGIAFILKYIGVIYILLAIFKGLYHEFSPSFDVLGITIFILGFVVEHRNDEKYKHLDE